MKIVVQIEHSASSSRSKREGESSFGLCDRLSRTRDNSQRQLPTDQEYAVSTREYQADQSSLKTAPTAARSVLEKTTKPTTTINPWIGQVDTVTPYQANALIERLACSQQLRTGANTASYLVFSISGSVRDLSKTSFRDHRGGKRLRNHPNRPQPSFHQPGPCGRWQLRSPQSHRPKNCLISESLRNSRAAPIM
jgi:hypothetical protein